MAALGRGRIVVKIGSALLVGPEGLRADWLAALCGDLAALRRDGAELVLVSSGAIALGRGLLGLGDGPLSLEQSQAAAATGQIRLANAYAAALDAHGITAAQVLVTLEDSANRRRYLNSRATLSTLLSLGALPIVNENDTVATDEIRYGDNDRLAAQVAVTVGADQLVLLSDVDGFYSANPQSDPGARRYDVIEAITPEIEAQAGEAASHLSRGGMRTKVMAARVATAAGCAMAIASGIAPHPLKRLDEGGPRTWFAATSDPHSARKAWIGAMAPRGQIGIDDGALRALHRGKSLLPAGAIGAQGDFERGDPVAICDAAGRVIGQGLSRYGADAVARICGHGSDEIAALLGYHGPAALIHRDDMILHEGASSSD